VGVGGGRGCGEARGDVRVKGSGWRRGRVVTKGRLMRDEGGGAGGGRRG